MSDDYQAAQVQPKALTIAGWVLTVLPCLLLVMSGVMKLQQSEEVVKGFADWPEGVAVPIAIAELVSTLLYLIPQTAMLGAILLTGYLGGATATHVRLGEDIWIPVVMGVVIWLGLFLRDPRIRQLVPWRNP
jgi:chaperone required for assembly of F1-ATPase